MIDTFHTHSTSLTSPPSSATIVQPSDVQDLTHASRAIHVGTAGDLRVLTLDGQEVTYRALQGTKVLRVRRIFATGTTASDIVVEW